MFQRGCTSGRQVELHSTSFNLSCLWILLIHSERDGMLYLIQNRLVLSCWDQYIMINKVYLMFNVNSFMRISFSRLNQRQIWHNSFSCTGTAPKQTRVEVGVPWLFFVSSCLALWLRALSFSSQFSRPSCWSPISPTRMIPPHRRQKSLPTTTGAVWATKYW